MESTIAAQFETRRDAEIAVEHLVQAHGIPRADIFVRARGIANSSRVKAAGADIESGHDSAQDRGTPELAGLIEVSVDYHGIDGELACPSSQRGLGCQQRGTRNLFGARDNQDGAARLFPAPGRRRQRMSTQQRATERAHS